MRIGVKCEWVLKLGSSVPCLTCKAEIEGARYNLEMSIGDKKTDTESNLCQLCYTKMKDNENNGQIPY